MDGRNQWLDTAVSGIRFKPDRAAVRAELLAHMEDREDALRRSFPDIPPEEARDRALSAMGNPEELKTALAKVHRPWLGWLWQFSKGLFWGALAVLLALCLLGHDHYQSAGFPLWMDWSAHLPAPGDRSPEKTEVGGFTFRITEAAWMGDEYALTLRASSPRFWERLDGEVLNNGLTAVRPDGSRWSMGREGGYTTVHLARWDLFGQEFDVYVPAEGWEPGSWVTLELESQQGGFALSAQVTGRGPEG